MFQVRDGDSIILASESTRRVDMLRTLGISFSIIPPNIDEKKRGDEQPGEFVLRISYEKADKVAQLFPENWVIAADTVVVLKGKVLGKPQNERDAYNMLKALAGKWHKVLTGYCVLNISRDIVYRDVVETRVFMKDLSNEEIKRYIKTTEPYDKAGSYAIQGKGGYMVKKIKGSYANVAGLPVCEVAEALISLGALS